MKGNVKLSSVAEDEIDKTVIEACKKIRELLAINNYRGASDLLIALTYLLGDDLKKGDE